MDKDIKITPEQAGKIKAIKEDYERKVDALKLDCEDRIQTILDDYHIQKTRDAINS